MEIGKHQYKEIDIWYDDFNEMWVCELDRKNRPHISEPKIQDVRKRIDSFVKKERKFERYEVIDLLGFGFRGEGVGKILTVTSHIDDEPGYCWVTKSEGSRSKEPLKRFTLKNESNQTALDGWLEVRAESEKLEKEANAGIKALSIGYKPEEEDKD